MPNLVSNPKGSSTLSPAHGKGGASATILSFLSAPPPEKSAGGFQQAGKNSFPPTPFLFVRLLPVRPKPRSEGGETPSDFFGRR